MRCENLGHVFVSDFSVWCSYTWGGTEECGCCSICNQLWSYGVKPGILFHLIHTTCGKLGDWDVKANRRIHRCGKSAFFFHVKDEFLVAWTWYRIQKCCKIFRSVRLAIHSRAFTELYNVVYKSSQRVLNTKTKNSWLSLQCCHQLAHNASLQVSYF